VADQKAAVEGFERLHVQVTQQQYRQLKKIAFERNAGSYGGEGQKTAIRAFKSPIRNSNC
jgi:hypothetical protein